MGQIQKTNSHSANERQHNRSPLSYTERVLFFLFLPTIAEHV
jgi:hypothetical protein